MDKRWPALVVVVLIEAEGLVVLGQCWSSGNGNLRLTPPNYIGTGALRGRCIDKLSLSGNKDAKREPVNYWRVLRKRAASRHRRSLGPGSAWAWG